MELGVHSMKIKLKRINNKNKLEYYISRYDTDNTNDMIVIFEQDGCYLNSIENILFNEFVQFNLNKTLVGLSDKQTNELNNVIDKNVNYSIPLNKVYEYYRENQFYYNIEHIGNNGKQIHYMKLAYNGYMYSIYEVYKDGNNYLCIYTKHNKLLAIIDNKEDYYDMYLSFDIFIINGNAIIPIIISVIYWDLTWLNNNIKHFPQEDLIDKFRYEFIEDINIFEEKVQLLREIL